MLDVEDHDPTVEAGGSPLRARPLSQPNVGLHPGSRQADRSAQALFSDPTPNEETKTQKSRAGQKDRLSNSRNEGPAGLIETRNRVTLVMRSNTSRERNCFRDERWLRASVERERKIGGIPNRWTTPLSAVGQSNRALPRASRRGLERRSRARTDKAAERAQGQD